MTSNTHHPSEAFEWTILREKKAAEREHKRLSANILKLEQELKVRDFRAKADTQKKSGKIADRESAARFSEFLLKHGSGGVSQWHFGRCELRELLDFIYGGEPASKKERLNND